MDEYTAKLYSVLAEFIRDVEAVGIKTVAKEWPDLAVTYRKALKAMEM